MAEDFGLCTYERHHKLKILMFLASMREKRDELLKCGFDVEYWDVEHPSFFDSYEQKLLDYKNKNEIEAFKMFEIEDKSFEDRILAFANKNNLSIEFMHSPMFLLKRAEFQDLSGKNATLRMAHFYKAMRKKFNLLIDKSQKPFGGKWSFDDENRKKIPKGFKIPGRHRPRHSKYINPLKIFISKNFSKHPGQMDYVWMATTRKDALAHVDHFLKNYFANFGRYEDAILKEDTFLFHSSISPLLNLGLVTPAEIIERVTTFVGNENIPLNSVEGFIRQVIGWREFVRGVYREHGAIQFNSNFFNFSRSLKESWYVGNTEIPPLDDAIKFSDQYGYTHHINRLMIISNIMTLCEVHPKEVYRWFMEMYVDSSEWVMTPNVFGMGTFADGGIFATKPYICGSNYILKMSNYTKGEWCETVDGLYWRFVHRHMHRLKNNPRLSFMNKTLEKMNKDRKDLIFRRAKEFIEKNCN